MQKKTNMSPSNNNWETEVCRSLSSADVMEAKLHRRCSKPHKNSNVRVVPQPTVQ